MMQLTRRRVKRVTAIYTLEGTVLENVDEINYLDITITNNSSLNTHVGNICTKGNRTLGFLRSNLSTCPERLKEVAYKRFGETSPGVCKSSLGPQWKKKKKKTHQDELRKLQNREAGLSMEIIF